MPVTRYWRQSGGCGRDTLSFLNAEAPNLVDLFEQRAIQPPWRAQPLLNAESLDNRLIRRGILKGQKRGIVAGPVEHTFNTLKEIPFPPRLRQEADLFQRFPRSGGYQRHAEQHLAATQIDAANLATPSELTCLR
ncbi:MAG: hypothetical protein HQM01_09040 [Magnetococcales bacterium]|nr:hypothetical protein [Magnetococcales bacterium]